MARNGWRRNNPRFQGENFTKNLAIADRLKTIAYQKNCTPAQLGLAWLLHKPDVIAIPGTSSLARLKDNAHAVDVELSDSDIAAIEDILPKAAAGARYDPAMLDLIDR